MLVEKQQRLLELTEALAGVGTWRLAVADNTVEWSDEVYRIHGVSRATFDPNQDNAIGFYHPDDRPLVRAHLARALADGEGFEFQLRIRRHDDDLRDVVCKADCERDLEGRTVALFGVLRDVTESQRVLRRAEFAETVAGLGHWRLDAKTHDIQWSPQMYRIYGIDPGAPLDLDVLMAMTHPDEAVDRVQSLQRQLEAGEPDAGLTTRIVRADGETRYLSGKSQVERGADGRILSVVGTVIDITDQKVAEQALVESEARYRRMATTAPDIITESRLDGVLTYVSPACLAITGFTPEDLVGKSSLELMLPADARAMEAMCLAVFESKGRIDPWPIQFRTRHKDGHEIWLESRPCLYVDPITGRYAGHTDILRDVTTHKALEASLEKALVEAEASAAVKGEFLANMSHELRTPLTAVLGFSRLVAEQPELTATTRGYVERLATAGKALLATVNDILDFSKLEAGQVEIKLRPDAPGMIVTETVALFETLSADKGVVLALSGLDSLPDQLWIDADRLRQVLLNLVGNAIKFTEQGQVRIEAAWSAEGERLTCRVVDTGPGIPADRLERLFQRFSQVDASTTRRYGGTGLGLAICKGLIEAMGGRIGADSTPGAGSTFWFELPARQATQAAPTGDPSTIGDTILPGGIRILVADDNRMNRELVRAMLSPFGAEISEAEDGRQALELARTQPFDAILMDMRMPEMNGEAAARQIRSENGPNCVSAILCFSADPDSGQYDVFDAWVAKPVVTADLVTAITLALNADPMGADHVAA